MLKELFSRIFRTKNTVVAPAASEPPASVVTKTAEPTEVVPAEQAVPDFETEEIGEVEMPVSETVPTEMLVVRGDVEVISEEFIEAEPSVTEADAVLAPDEQILVIEDEPVVEAVPAVEEAKPKPARKPNKGERLNAELEDLIKEAEERGDRRSLRQLRLARRPNGYIVGAVLEEVEIRWGKFDKKAEEIAERADADNEAEGIASENIEKFFSDDNPKGAKGVIAGVEKHLDRIFGDMSKIRDEASAAINIDGAADTIDDLPRTDEGLLRGRWVLFHMNKGKVAFTARAARGVIVEGFDRLVSELKQSIDERPAQHRDREDLVALIEGGTEDEGLSGRFEVDLLKLEEELVRFQTDPADAEVKETSDKIVDLGYRFGFLYKDAWWAFDALRNIRRCAPCVAMAGREGEVVFDILAHIGIAKLALKNAKPRKGVEEIPAEVEAQLSDDLLDEVRKMDSLCELAFKECRRTFGKLKAMGYFHGLEPRNTSRQTAPNPRPRRVGSVVDGLEKRVEEHERAEARKAQLQAAKNAQIAPPPPFCSVCEQEAAAGERAMGNRGYATNGDLCRKHASPPPRKHREPEQKQGKKGGKKDKKGKNKS